MIVRWVWGLLASAQQSQFGDLWGEAAAGGTRFSLRLCLSSKTLFFFVSFFCFYYVVVCYGCAFYHHWHTIHLKLSFLEKHVIQVVMGVYYLVHNIAFIAWVLHHNSGQVSSYKTTQAWEKSLSYNHEHHDEGGGAWGKLVVNVQHGLPVPLLLPPAHHCWRFLLRLAHPSDCHEERTIVVQTLSMF